MRPLLYLMTTFLTIAPAIATERTVAPKLGMPLDPATMASYDTMVFPDGSGLPPGSGNVSDGESLYVQKCLVCHGKRGRGGSGEELSGGLPDLTRDSPDQTIGTYWPHATTLFDFIRRAMPMHQPGSLSADEVYALTAYLLFENDVIDKSVVLNAQTLSSIRMPNRDGFDWIDITKDGDLVQP